MKFLFALTVPGEETTFWEDVWNYLYDVYLRADGNYEYLWLDKMPLFSIRLTVLGLFIGIVLACIAMVYHKRVIGGAVRRIIQRGASSPETALTVEELGYSKNPIIKNALASSSALRNTVHCVEQDEFNRRQNEELEQYEQKRAENKKLPKYRLREYMIDTETDRFYIPEELRIRAEIKFDKKGTGWLSLTLSLIVISVIFFAVLLLLPMLLGFLDSLLAG